MRLLQEVLVVAVVVAGLSLSEGKVIWGECPFGSEQRSPAVAAFTRALRHADGANASSFKVECTNNLTVPLIWEAYPYGDSRTISLWATRIVPADSTRQITDHMFMLQGGPGGSGEGLEQALAGFFTKVDMFSLFSGKSTAPQSFAFIFPDHRGTGLSTPLECSVSSTPYTEQQWTQCAQELLKKWGPDGLAAFSATSAGRDLDHMISQISTPEVNDRVHVYGVSYGTYWAQRYLQVRTRDPKSVMLDGICYPPKVDLGTYDVNYDQSGKMLLGKCMSDTWCSAQFEGRNPLVVLQRIFDQLNLQPGGGAVGKCFDAVGRAMPQPYNKTLQFIMGAATGNEYLRLLIPPLITKIDRCNSRDVEAIRKLLSAFSKDSQKDGNGEYPPSMNSFLSVNVGFSELTLKPVDMNELLRIESTLLFSPQSIMGEVALAYSIWPKYEPDKYYPQLPDLGSIPVLLLHGDLDPATPFSWGTALYNRFVLDQPQAKVKFLKMNNAVHGTIGNTHMVGVRDVTCSLLTMASFVSDPNGKLDDSCVAKLESLDWAGTSDKLRSLSISVFGSDNMWN